MAKIDIESHKLMYHPEKVSEWREKGDCYPIYIDIGLANICNHNCIFCGLDWARGKNILDTNILIKTLEDMAKNGVKSICFSGAGESLLHKDFSFLVKKAKELGLDVSFSTNSVLFDEKKAEETLPYTSWIRFSIDAATPSTHAKIHGTSEQDFNKIINNLKKAVEIKKKNNYKTTLGVQLLLIEENKNEVLEFGKLMKEIGVDNIQIKPYSLNPNSISRMNPDYTGLEEIENELRKLETKDFKVFFRVKPSKINEERDYNICHGLPFFAVINEKGNVMPCHLYYDIQDFSYGNIYKNTFSEIWQSQQRKQVIKKIKEKGIEKCKTHCRLDLINSYLHRLKNPEPHDNFP